MLIKVENISKVYGESCGKCKELTGAATGTNICPSCGSVVAVNDVSFQMHDGQVLGVVGESGSGKSTLVQMIFQDQKPSEGFVFLDGFLDEGGEPKNIFDGSLLEKNMLRNIDMSMIYQNPRIGLNFSFSAGGNIAERIIMTGVRSYEEIKGRVLNRLSQTELPTERVNDRPEQFSGGQQQRIQISKALSNSPKILLLDEPTTGLDLSVQARIIDLIKDLQKEHGFAMIVVSHDLGVIRHLTDITMVMKSGEMVEYGLTDQILEDPQHAYTQTLVSSVL